MGKNPRKRRLVLVVLALVASLAPISPANSAAPSSSPAPALLAPPNPAVAPELTKDQKARIKNKCEGEKLEFIPEGDACSHGADPAPAGKNIYVDVKPVKAVSAPESGGSTTTAEAAPVFACDGDGVTGNRTQVLYVRASDMPDRYSTYKASFLSWTSGADQIYRRSAAQTGGNQRMRFVHDSSCTPVIASVVIAPTAIDDFGATINALRALGYNRTDRTYITLVDANVYCGVGTVEVDDSFSQTNFNNVGPSYARIDAGCWSSNVIAHEHMHNLGGVQPTAPNTSKGMHCTDEYDVMCYSDSPNYPPMIQMCLDSAFNTQNFDCNKDDYFNSNPAPGSYLATKWNTANSRFLVNSAEAVCPDAATEPDNSAALAYRMTQLGSPKSGAFCTQADSDWVVFKGSAGQSYYVTASELSTGTVPAIDVFSTDGQLLLQHDDAFGSSLAEVTFMARTSGDYYVRVTDTAPTFPSAFKTYKVRATEANVTLPPVTGWGFNANGQLGWSQPPNIPRADPGVSFVDGGSKGQTSAGMLHSLAVRKDGQVWASGWNVYGQLGNNSTIDGTGSVVPGLNNVVSVAAGGIHSLAAKSDGTVWAWGWNGLGQLGDGTLLDRLTPVQVPGLSDVVEVAAGTFHSLALTRDGTVWAWGYNIFGAVGDGTLTTRQVPVKVSMPKATSVSGGAYHSVATGSDGRVYSWGWNGFGMLGDGTRIDRLTPVQLPGIAGVYRASAGFLHSTALKSDGSVWAWGWNAVQQVGGAPTTDQIIPTAVRCSSDPECPKSAGPNLGGIVWISSGGFHNLALARDGTVWSWGWNAVGMLGNGTIADSGTAVRSRLETANNGQRLVSRYVSAGYLHNLAG